MKDDSEEIDRLIRNEQRMGREVPQSERIRRPVAQDAVLQEARPSAATAEAQNEPPQVSTTDRVTPGGGHPAHTCVQHVQKSSSPEGVDNSASHGGG